MTLWAAYVRTGKEFDAQEECETLGITCHVPRRVDMIRQGKRRRPDPVVKPFLPNYVFIEATPAQWHDLKDTKLIRTTMGIGEGNARLVHRFIAKVEADYAERMAQINAGERVSEYAENDLLEILEGGFREKLLRFSRVAEGANGFPIVLAKAELFGREVEVPLDPLIVKKAANA